MATTPDIDTNRLGIQKCVQACDIFRQMRYDKVTTAAINRVNIAWI